MSLNSGRIDVLVLTGSQESCAGDTARILPGIRVGTVALPASGEGRAWLQVESEAARYGARLLEVAQSYEVASAEGAAVEAPRQVRGTLSSAHRAAGRAPCSLDVQTPPRRLLPRQAALTCSTQAAGRPRRRVGGGSRAVPRVAAVSPEADEDVLAALEMAQGLDARGSTVTLGLNGDVGTPR